MVSILTRAFGFVLVIYLGYFLRMKGITSARDGRLLSLIIMNVTLPCAILTSASPLRFSPVLLVPFLLGMLANALLDVLGYQTHRYSEPLEKAVAIVDNSGFNIGTFALPFVQAFFPSSYILNVLLFDTGNSVMCIRGNFLLAERVLKKSDTGSPLAFLRRLFASIPLCTYILTLIISLAHISIPKPLLNITSIAGNANPFLAMLMIGTLVDFAISREEIAELLKQLGGRLLLIACLAALVYFALPISLIMRQMMVLCLFAPISTLGPVHAMQLGSRSPEPANLNTLSIFVSIVFLTLFSILFI